MITGTKRVRSTIEYVFELPMTARDIADALFMVDKKHSTSWDNRYHVRTDGENLIFYWEETE